MAIIALEFTQLQIYLGIIINAFFTGVGIACGLYIANRHIIEQFGKLFKKIKKKLKKKWN